ncbi:MAG: S8 family peptidase [Bacteroidota bacterium]
MKKKYISFHPEKSKYLFAFAFVVFIFHAEAQYSKINFGATISVNKKEIQEKTIHLLVRGNVSEIEKFTKQYGGTFRYAVGDIASINLPVKNISTLAEKQFVKRIEANNLFNKTKPLNDSMLISMRVIPVHLGILPLTKTYQGEGVVIGIIDTGIDYRHPDFKDSIGKTRIKFLWDQVTPDSGKAPQPYNYGREWNNTQIDSGLASAHQTTAISWWSHGSHVASEATGNGLATGNYKGVAPKSDIIFVALNFQKPVNNMVVDAVNYIYSKATALGKPCVINASFGDYYGSHDGSDLQSQVIKNLITAQNGRSLVSAAGNAGNVAFHLGYTVTSDTNFTWFNSTTGLYFIIYADTNNFKNIRFSIGADKISPRYLFRGNIPFSNITPHIGKMISDTLYNGSNRIGIIQSYGEKNGGIYSMEYFITPDSTTYNWRLMTTGYGKFDAWVFNQKGEPINIVSANLADSTIFPPLKKYKQPDFNQTIVSGFQCLDEVITVGSYVNRNQHVDIDTILQTNNIYIPGALAASSSHGPTRDGRIKPDITAPGDYILGCFTLSQIPILVGAGQGSAIGVGGAHTVNSGTSFASPAIAGVAALILQNDPNASYLDVKNAIVNCAWQDSFTGGDLPNNLWGYGKVDAFASLTTCATTNSINQSIIDSEEFIIYPNPFSSEAFLRIFSKEKLQNAELKIYDIIGKEVKTIPMKDSQSAVLEKGCLKNGIYFCQLKSGDRIIATQKFIICE